MMLLVLLACGGPKLDASPGPADTDGPVEYDYYRDADGDGFGAGAIAERSPVPLDVAGLSARGDDCDDADAPVHPDALERCDGKDDDCDGAVDMPAPPDAPVGWQDADGDGYGTDTVVHGCDGVAANALDCDDSDPTVFPGALDIEGNAQDGDCGVDQDPTVGVRALAAVRFSDAAPYAVAAGDITGDGVTDLVTVVDGDTVGAAVVAGPIAGAMPARPVVWLSANTRLDAEDVALVVADVTADDGEDVAVGSALYAGPATADATPALLDGAVGLAAADLTGDGRADLVEADRSNEARLLAGPWSRDAPALTWSTHFYDISAVAIADTDGDGVAEPWFGARDADAATGLPGRRGPYQLGAWHGGSAGPASSPDGRVYVDVPWFPPWHPVGVVGPDVDDDGVPDVVCAMDGDGVRLVRFDFEASREWMSSMPKLGLPRVDSFAVAAADADGDGLEDVLVSAASAHGGVVYVLQGW